MPALKENPNGSPHIHEYIRKTPGKRDSLYCCAHPKCSHWLKQLDIKGKESLCAICHTNVIILTYHQLQRARPRCEACSNTKKAVAKRETLAKLEAMGII